jgi:sterol 3beta-glucosyltransferase
MSSHDPPQLVSRDYTLTPQSDIAIVQKHSDLGEVNDGSASPRKRLTRVVGKSVDNMTRSFISGSGKSTPQQQKTTASPPGHRRLFSLSRKGKAKELAGFPDSKWLPWQIFKSIDLAVPVDTSGDGLAAQGTYGSQQNAPSRSTSPIIAGAGDDSPFIRPKSPSAPAPPTRPSLQAFRGDGSVSLICYKLV